MPVPTFNFEDEQRGLPRQPIPVRLACLISNWSPGLLATLLAGDENLGGILITAWEFNEDSQRIGEVHPSNYNQYRDLGDINSVSIAKLPVNNFVWSDDLVSAFSDFIDSTTDRESASSSSLGVRWNVALGDCRDVIAECPDMQRLLTPTESNRMHSVGDVCTITYGEQTIRLKNSLGLRYIHYLLSHADKEISVTILQRAINPLPPEALINLSPENLLDGNDSSFHNHGQGSFDPVMDEKALANINSRKQALEEQIEDLKVRNKIDEAATAEEELEQINKHLLASIDVKGKPRRFNSDTEKIRKAVSKSIKSAINDIASRNLLLGQHLSTTINTGYNCRYTPRPAIRWSL